MNPLNDYIVIIPQQPSSSDPGKQKRPIEDYLYQNITLTSVSIPPQNIQEHVKLTMMVKVLALNILAVLSLVSCEYANNEHKSVSLQANTVQGSHNNFGSANEVADFWERELKYSSHRKGGKGSKHLKKGKGHKSNKSKYSKKGHKSYKYNRRELSEDVAAADFWDRELGASSYRKHAKNSSKGYKSGKGNKAGKSYKSGKHYKSGKSHKPKHSSKSYKYSRRDLELEGEYVDYWNRDFDSDDEHVIGTPLDSADSSVFWERELKYSSSKNRNGYKSGKAYKSGKGYKSDKGYKSGKGYKAGKGHTSKAYKPTYSKHSKKSYTYKRRNLGENNRSTTGLNEVPLTISIEEKINDTSRSQLRR